MAIKSDPVGSARHYYHENEDVLRQAVSAIPSFGTEGGYKPAVARSAAGAAVDPHARASRTEGVSARLRRLDRLFAKNLITEGEYAATRQRILNEI